VLLRSLSIEAKEIPLTPSGESVGWASDKNVKNKAIADQQAQDARPMSPQELFDWAFHCWQMSHMNACDGTKENRRLDRWFQRAKKRAIRIDTDLCVGHSYILRPDHGIKARCMKDIYEGIF